MTLTPQIIQQMIQTEKNRALYNAAKMGDISDLNALLDANAYPLSEIGLFNENALMAAATNGHLDVVNRLLEFPAVQAQITAFDNEALRSAAYMGHLDVVNRLLELPAVAAQITAADNDALRAAAYNGHLDVVNRLLEFPAVVAEITAVDNEALRAAANKGHLDVVNRLLEFPDVVAQITAQNNGALVYTIDSMTRSWNFLTTVIAKIIALITGNKYNYDYLNVVNRLLSFPAVKEAMHDDSRAILTKHGFYDWQKNQRQQILSTIKGALHQGMPPELIMPVLKRNHPSFSEAVLNKQIEFCKKQVRAAMAAPAAPLTFAAPATDSSGKKRKRDEDDNHGPTSKRPNL